jgi:hypothetical protein
LRLEPSIPRENDPWSLPKLTGIAYFGDSTISRLEKVAAVANHCSRIFQLIFSWKHNFIETLFFPG